MPPPAPPPRDPRAIRRSLHRPTLVRDADEMSSGDSGSSPPPANRRSSYENVPPPLAARRATPSPRPRSGRASPADPRHDDSRRPSRAPRRSLPPPVECVAWAGGHGPCCPSPLPYLWGCGPSPQGWAPVCSHVPHAMDEGFNCEDSGALQQRVKVLQNEKEQLALQVNVLNDQVEAQNEKIQELESSLSNCERLINNTESLLKKEMALRSSLESNRLDLVAQISSIRLRLSQVEGEKRNFEERSAKLENELILTCACLAEKEADLATFKSKLVRNGSVTPKFEYNMEMDKLRAALTSVLSVNDEKEKTIQEMQTSLNRYKRLHELVLSNPSRRLAEGSLSKSMNDESFHMTLDNITCSNLEDNMILCSGLSDKPPPVPRLGEELRQSSSRSRDISISSLSNPFPCSSPQNFSPCPTPQKTPPSKRHYSTLPRPSQLDALPGNSSTPISTSVSSHSFHNLHHPNFDTSSQRCKAVPSGSSFGKGFFKLRLGRRSCSAPELAPEQLESMPKTTSSDRRTSSPLPLHIPQEKARGLRRIFGKVKRTSSDSLHSSVAELKRGGIRATAAPRLGWKQNEKPSFTANLPLNQWDVNMVAQWLNVLGLGMYAPYARKWLVSGEQLLKSKLSDFEKELHMKNPLHRKKLLLAVVSEKGSEGPEALDPEWVVRWLDDIGLPHYKDNFSDALVDGRMLHHLTMEDLSYLKVSNHLHILSIKTGIRVLRENRFQPHCLLRRPLPEDVGSPQEVSRWTNHRVMEWLRNVDLSEYAPNLRGSGVHGGFMMHEPGFNAELLASLLNIPPSKTLLRRHLTTQFRSLIGSDILQQKREWEVRGMPLSLSSKIKTTKKSPFSIGKRKYKNAIDPDDYVCPLANHEDMTEKSLLNKTEEEKFLMKEMVLKKEKHMESLPVSNV